MRFAITSILLACLIVAGFAAPTGSGAADLQERGAPKSKKPYKCFSMKHSSRSSHKRNLLEDNYERHFEGDLYERDLEEKSYGRDVGDEMFERGLEAYSPLERRASTTVYHATTSSNAESIHSMGIQLMLCSCGGDFSSVGTSAFYVATDKHAVKNFVQTLYPHDTIEVLEFSLNLSGLKVVDLGAETSSAWQTAVSGISSGRTPSNIASADVVQGGMSGSSGIIQLAIKTTKAVGAMKLK